MKSSAAFAIVDLETTASSVEKGGRIIQIGMTFVKNHQIMEHFDSFVNPGQPIDKKIQQLTQIHPKEVRDAPYFEELAPSLQSLLQGQVFVAHNVNFDLPFLNAEFERVGLAPLDLVAVDTVQLAQILYPTEAGYRLSDLTQSLSLPLVQAHRANADAEATAHLLLNLWDRAAALPAAVKKSLQLADWGLIRETQAFLKMACQQDSVPANQASAKQAKHQTGRTNHHAYPKTLAEKNRLLPADQTVSTIQANAMDFVHRFLENSQRALWQLQYGPALGQTTAYLLPLFFQKKKSPVWLVSGDEALLAQQERLLADLNVRQSGKQRHRIARLEQPSDYLDEQAFQAALTAAKTAGGSPTLARLLVWSSLSDKQSLLELPRGLRNQGLLDRFRGTATSPAFQKAYQAAQEADLVLLSLTAMLSQGSRLRSQQLRQRGTLPVIMEKPLQLADELQSYFGFSLPLSFYQEQVEKIQEQGQQLDKQSAGAFKLAVHNYEQARTRLQQSQSLAGQMRAAKSLLRRVQDLLHLADQSAITYRLSPRLLQQYQERLDFLAANQQYVQGIRFLEEGEADFCQLLVDVSLLYQKYLLQVADRLLVVSRYYPDSLQALLASTPKGFQQQVQGPAEQQSPVPLLVTQASQEDQVLQQLVERGRQQIVIVASGSAAVKHWYFRLSDRYGADFAVFGQDISAGLAKVSWQSQQAAQSILVVDQRYLDHVQEQAYQLPATVLLSQARQWQEVVDLMPLVRSLQKTKHGILIGSLNRRQVRALGDSVKMVKNSAAALRFHQ
ncbi:exonuclease domain-containing protein [Leuconostocaceae bacterium ESL0958]|nr:exonuclease domain-containing protein [Leuconostocaceae bacterium ESL0958]